MEQVRSNGEQKELRDEIVDLGTRYGIVTPYTSYLATENLTSLNAVNLNTEPAQIRNDGRGFMGALNAPKAARSAPPNASPAVTIAADTGAGAVQQSKRAREQQEAAKLNDETRTDAVRRVEGKTFYLIDGVWTDSEFKVETRLPETALIFASDEYFALLKQHPKLASYFSLGERVVVVFEGRVYRVNAAAP
jgi:Ca-activated chloride channel family protein